MEQEKMLPWKNWEVVKLIGRGTYGDVYEIQKKNAGYSTKAALKIIHVSLDEQKKRELESEKVSLNSYLQETQSSVVSEIYIMESLKSASHIVTIEDYEIQEEKDGWTLFIRMELLKSLVQLQSERNFTKGEVLKLGMDLCEGLQACWRKGVIHRDIKPANIFISEFGDYKLGDFGISRQLEHTMAGSTRAGTESYMAPEVFYGKTYDATVDIYSLGIVLYRLANRGKLPFVSQDTDTVSYNEVIRAKQKRLDGGIFPDPAAGGKKLGDILRKACAFDSEDRYQSPQEMYEELKKLLQSYDQKQKNEEIANVSEKKGAEEDIQFFTAPEDAAIEDEPVKDIPAKPDIGKKPDTVKPEKAPELQKRSGKLPVIAAILCVVGIVTAAGGYMKTADSQKAEQKETQEVSVTAVPTVILTQTPIPTVMPTVEVSPTETAREENSQDTGESEENDWFNNLEQEENDWFDDWNYNESGNKIN